MRACNSLSIYSRQVPDMKIGLKLGRYEVYRSLQSYSLLDTGIAYVSGAKTDLIYAKRSQNICEKFLSRNIFIRK